MSDKVAQQYREAADAIWELSKQFPQGEVAEELKTIATDLHAKAANRPKK